MAQNNFDASYWKSRYDQEKRIAGENLRLAAERAQEIGELRDRLKLEMARAAATEQKLDAYREALEYGLHCLSSHQVYDKDMGGTFERVLAGGTVSGCPVLVDQ